MRAILELNRATFTCGRKSTRLFALATAAMASIAWAPALARSPQPRREAADIRFGVIEPPVVAQRDITIRAATSNQQRAPVPLECSGLAWVDGSLLLVSDRHGHVLFTCPVDLANMTIGEPRPHVLIPNEQKLLDDAECLALCSRGSDAWIGYALCSLSNDHRAVPLPQRRHMLRFVYSQSRGFTAERPVVLDAGTIRDALDEHFQAVGVEPYETFYAQADKNTYRWGNVEGLAFTPDGSRVLCALRNPLYRGQALLCAIEGLEEAFHLEDLARIRVTDVFTLDLGERGVSDLCWDPVARGYLIAAGKSNGPKRGQDEPFPPNTLDCALFWWSGRKSEQPVLFARTPDMKVEAVCRLGESRYIAMCSDEGDVSEERANRPQSVITIMDFSGW